MSNNLNFVLFDPESPGEIGGVQKGPANFTHILVDTDASYPESIRVLVTTPSTHGAPKGALNIDVLNAADTNPAVSVFHGGSGPKIKIEDGGTGPDIQLKTGVTITELSGEIVFQDTVTGPVTLTQLLSAVSISRGAVSVNTLIPAGTTVTASNTTVLSPYASGLRPYTSFVPDLIIYLNGQLMASGTSSSTDNDVYPAGIAANGEMAFEFDLQAGDIIQIIKVA